MPKEALSEKPSVTPATPDTQSAGAAETKPPAAKADDEAKTDIGGIKTFVSKALGLDKKPKSAEPKEEKPKGEKPKEEKEKPKGEKEPTPAEKPKVEKPKPKPAHAASPPPALSATEIAAAAAEGVTRVLGVKPATESPKTAATSPADVDLSPSNKRRMQVLQHLEKLQPETYKGIAARYRESLQKLEDYAKSWKAKNPGREFDETDSEHEEFMDSVDVQWEDDDYVDALADLRSEEKIKPILKQNEEREREEAKRVERAAKMEEEAPNLFTEQNKAADVFWTSFGDEFKGVIQQDGTVNREQLQKLATADPVAYQQQVAAAQQLDHETREIFLLYNGLKDPVLEIPRANDPAYKQKLADYTLQQELSDFAWKAERALMAKPKEERLDAQGRDFLPAERYSKLGRDQRDAYWTLGASDLIALRTQELARVTKQKLAADEEKFQRWAAARGLTPQRRAGSEVSEPHASNQPQNAPDYEDEDGKPVSPESTSAPKMATAKAGASDEPDSPLKTFVNRALGKR